ncbi:MAG: hypothetical protein C1942_03520 [Prosthecochloris sp.]|uniref:CPBP family intramembrane glutamic endopeptidase n=1 Tax=Prosthecochloris sp. TaxID=290513 RepID=UPI0013C8A2FC|nr:CPBP family intramembrane glutamic endopeptidase [Prosthecochloris sp.]NEX11759.1 hypothetical protein [Prosthecochloris sp.]
MEKRFFFRFLPVVFLLFFLPASLVAAGYIPFWFRIPLLLFSFCLTVLYSYYRGFTLRDLGIRRDNLAASLRVNSVVTLCFSVLMGLLFYFELIPGPYFPAMGVFLPFYLLVSSPLQEFLFRGFLFAEMRASGVRSGFLLVVFSALLFSFIHIVYGDWLTLVLTFLIGFVWGGIYYRIPNIAGLSVFHAIAGMLALLAGVARNM